MLAVLSVMLLLSCVFASNLSVSVKDIWGTYLKGTTIELLQDSVAVAQARADVVGNQTFPVQDGTYIARFTRGGYPVYVTIVKVQGNTNITYTMAQSRSYAVYYGTVGGSADGLNVSALQNGVVKASSKVVGNAYVLPFLDEGKYEFSFGSKYPSSRVNVSVASYETKLLDLELKEEMQPNASVPQQAKPVLVVLEQGGLYAPIRVAVLRGDAPEANAAVKVLTPDGSMDVGADENGIVVINAAAGGAYVFTYEGVQASVQIEAAQGETPAQAQGTQTQGGNEAAKDAQGAAAGAQAQGGNEEAQRVDVNALAFAAVGGIAIGAVVLGAVAYLLLRKKGDAYGHEGAQSGLEHGELAHGQQKHAKAHRKSSHAKKTLDG